MSKELEEIKRQIDSYYEMQNKNASWLALFGDKLLDSICEMIMNYLLHADIRADIKESFENIQEKRNIEDFYTLYVILGFIEEDQQKKYNELSPEIIDLLNIKENDDAILDDNPILRCITRKDNNIANYGENVGQVRIIEKSGKLEPFHAAVFMTAIKAYRNKKCTKEGYIVLTENQAIKVMLGTSGTPSEKQKADFRQAWEDMRNESMTYETSESLAQILGVDQESIEEYIPGIKEKPVNIVEEYFVQGLKVIKGQAVNGKLTDIYLIKPSDIIRKCIDSFPWYEEITPEIQRVMKKDASGKLTTWGYSKQRTGLQQHIFAWVYKCKRARAVNKNISLSLRYDETFEECMINVSHRQEKKRRIEDVKTILDHLKRCGEIADWNEYQDKVGKPCGVRITLYKEGLI